VPVFQRISKTAACASVLLIVVFLLALHHDITWLLRTAGAAAFLVGWFAGGRVEGVQATWLLMAPLAPACFRLLAGREGEVLDLPWMAGLAGGLLRGASWSRWAFPQAWGPLLGGWALALSLSWPVLVARESGFALQGLVDAGAINSWAMRSAPQVIGWTLYIVLTQLLGLLWFERVRHVFASRRGTLPLVTHALWIGVTAASLVAVIQGTVDFGFLSLEPWVSGRRATGTMLDANSYAICAALAAPISFLAMGTLLPGRPSASVAVLALNWAGMWMSGSRTALLCAAAGAAGLAVELWRGRQQSSSLRAPLVASAIVAVVVLVGFAASAVGPVQRLFEVPMGRAGAAALFDRGGYGPVARRMIGEYPLTGVGSGSYQVLAADYWRAMEDQALPWDNAQNWWRHQLVELGLLGGGPILLFSAFVAWWVVTGRVGTDPPMSAETVRGLLAGLGAASLFGVPTQNPLALLWFLFLVGWLTSSLPDTPGAGGSRWTSARWFVTCGLAVAFTVGHMVIAAGSLDVAERARTFRREYVTGAYAEEPMGGLGQGQFRWTGKQAHFVWPVRTRWFVMQMWAHHPDIAAQPVRVTVITACGIVLERDLNGPEKLTVGIVLPEGQSTLDATVLVSRTWQPSDAGGGDPRRLGVAVSTDFVETREQAMATHVPVQLQACGREGV
jgi:hypothetical protein